MRITEAAEGGEKKKGYTFRFRTHTTAGKWCSVLGE